MNNKIDLHEDVVLQHHHINVVVVPFEADLNQLFGKTVSKIRNQFTFAAELKLNEMNIFAGSLNQSEYQQQQQQGSGSPNRGFINQQPAQGQGQRGRQGRRMRRPYGRF